MNTRDRNHFALSTAVLCMDCDHISNNLMSCANCGSSAVMGLSAILNRTEVPAHEVARVIYELERIEITKENSR